MTDVGSPKGTKTDTLGNLYLGIDDGVSVWDESGDVVGKNLIEGGIANLGFGEPGVLFAMGDIRLWRIDISKQIVGSASLI
jgi:gluconolactonase